MLWNTLQCHSISLAQTRLLRRATRSFVFPQQRSFARIPRLTRSPPQRPGYFREELVTREGKTFTDEIGPPPIRNQVIFVALGSLIAFSYAARETNLDTEYWTTKLTVMSNVWTSGNITSVDLKRAQNVDLVKKLRGWYAVINERIEDVPGTLKSYVGLIYVTLAQPYVDASAGKRLCWKICLLNVAVWSAWKLRRFQKPMSTSFMHHPLSGLSFTLLTSMFSHRTFFHLLLNCLALESFGSAAYYYLLKEQGKTSHQLESTTGYHFMAFFVSAGLFSGLVSHIVSAKLRYPRLVSQLASPSNITKRTDTWAAAVAATTANAKTVAKKTVPDILPSLGASGAIYATVTLTALGFPDSQVALFIPPSYPISIQWGVGGMVLMDVIGVLRGWRYLDHWAHLGGAAFGVAYYAYGPKFWNFMRQTEQQLYDRSPRFSRKEL